ncbi:DUF551 domain-containing protein [Klebsiella sp. GG_Kp174]|uniref:DUF551 domain-containing protein n=1 Tax=Klebsiella TaxID=570 RepID=UPI002B05EA69|nr:DUF551 domain-containing protein [Klebsiella quasipneumoniae]HCI6753974.1 DUF551 domain-containing protein [Klebsiella quasipneumoniae subsp. quasipneumoniae]
MTSKLTRDQLRERAQLKAKNLTYANSQSAFAGVRSELEEELQFLQCALACLEGVNSEPAPVVPEKCPAEIRYLIASHSDALFNDDDAQEIWNACLAAMHQVGNSPAQSVCYLAQNHVSPEQNGDTPAQSQGWIPLSEQMPPSRHEVLVGRWWGEKPRWCCKWATYIPGHPDAQSSGWLIPGASWTPTHWMPLPAAPRRR